MAFFIGIFIGELGPLLGLLNDFRLTKNGFLNFLLRNFTVIILGDLIRYSRGEKKSFLSIKKKNPKLESLMMRARLKLDFKFRSSTTKV